MISKATLTLCLVLVGLAGVLATKKSRFSQFFNVKESTNNTNSFTSGICNLASSDFNLIGTQTFSVYNNDVDLYLNYTSASLYGVNEFCQVFISGETKYPHFKVEIIYNSERDLDKLTLLSGNYRGTYSGLGYRRETRVLPTNKVVLSWESDSSVQYELGFSLRLSGTYEEVGVQYPATLGICAISYSAFYLTGAQTFSVFDNDVDLHLNYTNAPQYNNNAQCVLDIYGEATFPHLKLEITINSELNNDFLSLSTTNYFSRISGRGYNTTTIVLPSNAVTVQWLTDFSVQYKLGFSLKASGTFENATVPHYPNTATVGLCNQNFKVFYLSGPQTFSVYDNDADLSLNYTSAPQYANNANCEYTIESKEYSRLKVELTIHSQYDYDHLYIASESYQREFSGLGYIRITIVVPSNSFYVLWRTNGETAYRLGFSMRVSGVKEEATKPAVN